MVKIIQIKKSHKRVVAGKLANQLDVDWNLPLTELRDLIQLAIKEYIEFLPALKKYRNGKELDVYQGSNHLDLIVSGEGTTNLLKVIDEEKPTTTVFSDSAF